MKKIYTLILLCSAAVMSFAQTFTVNQDSLTINGTDAMNDFYDDLPVYNSTSSTVQMKWVRISENMPTPWYTSICDAVTCHGSNVDSAFFNLPASGSNYINLHFYPVSTAGIGTVKILIYVVNNPSERDTLTFIGNAAASLGIAEASSVEFNFSPNPANDNITVTFADGNTKGGTIELYNAIGQKVVQTKYTPAAKSLTVNVSSLPKGYYFMKAIDDSGNSTIKKLVKN